MLARFEGRFDVLIPEGKESAFRERLVQLVLLAATKQPELLKCTQESVLQSVMDAAQTGLDISASRGDAALVPFFNSRSRKHECQFVPMYRGLARLARNPSRSARRQIAQTRLATHL